MNTYLVGIAGGTASGKTTLARRLFELAGADRATLIELDRYYRCQHHIDPSERVKANYDHPSSLEFDLLIQHLQQLKAGSSVQAPIYDFTQHTRCKNGSSIIRPRAIIIIEGILIFALPELRSLFNLRVFVDTPPEVRLNRRNERDVRERGRTRQGVIEQWNSTVQPMHLQFCEPSKYSTDIIFDGTTADHAPINTLWKRICELAQPDTNPPEGSIEKAF